MGRAKKVPKIKEMLKKYLPINDIFTPDEFEMYEGLVDIYLNDFDETQLSANDMDSFRDAFT